MSGYAEGEQERAELIVAPGCDTAPKEISSLPYQWVVYNPLHQNLHLT